MSMIADPVTAALNELRFVIPAVILQKVFVQRHEKWRTKHQSINERIMEEVIRPRVLQDCNIAYGQEVLVDLSECESELVDGTIMVYRIPKSLTQGRSILSALQVSYGIPGYTGVGGGMTNIASSALQQGANALADANAPMPITSTHNVTLIGENTVMIRDTLRMAGNMFLRCVLENDERMTHLHYKNIPIFKQLVAQAVKSYIYNVYMIEMDMAELHAGQELGTIKNIIEGYADAEELYQEILREKYARAAVSTDEIQMRRYLKAMIGGFR